MTVVRYRKRPIEVDTIRWTGDNEAQVQAFTGGAATFYALTEEDRESSDDPAATAAVFDRLHSTWILVYTGQHIVRGVRGEYHPIADDVLTETYELATDPPPGQAYDGELPMLRGLVRTLRAVVRDDRADLAQREVRRLLIEHTADERAAYEQGKSSHQADATPDFFQPGRTYKEPGDVTDWRFRCDFVTTHPGTGERTALGWRHFRGAWEPYAYEEDSFEIHQIADAIATTQGDSK